MYRKIKKLKKIILIIVFPNKVLVKILKKLRMKKKKIALIKQILVQVN